MASLPITAQAVLTLGVVVAAWWAYREVVWRRTRQFAAWTQPSEPSLLWGHAATVEMERRKLPPNSHIDIAFNAIREKLGRPAVYLADFRPFSYPMLVVGSGYVAEQLSRATKADPYSSPKSPTLTDIEPLVGAHSMLTREGEQWKSMRRHLNPGFAPKHLLSLLPCILDKTEQFLGHLDARARSGETFELHELTLNLTFDIIGAVIADADFAAQKGPDQQSPILKDFTALIATFKSPPGPGMDVLNLPLRARRWIITRRLDRNIKAQIQTYFAELQRQQRLGGKIAGPKSRSVLALGLAGAGQGVDDAYIDMICSQLKTFFFAGHDTTSVLLQWATHEIWRRPRVLATLRAELDGVFGEGQAADPAVIRERLLAPGGEEILSRLPYTSAIFKETLRLYPPAGSAKMPRAGTRLALPDGTVTPPLGDVVVYIAHYLIQRDKSVYGEDADDFVPERWLGNTNTHADDEDEGAEVADEKQQQHSSIPASSWRPFERGPRNCIGQELANIEFRVILACTVARYDFEKVGLGEAATDAHGNPILTTKGYYETKSDLYNIMEVTAKPADGTRMRVRLSERARSGAIGK